MGYAMTVPFKTAEERERMKSFLLENTDILNKLKENKPFEPSHENTPYDGEDLTYAPNKKHLLGFYGSGIPSYIWDVCAWMSVKSGVRDKKGLPYVYYDNEKEIITFDTNDQINTVVDQEGVRIRVEPHESIPKQLIEMLQGTKKEQQNSNKLLNQLNDSWKEYIVNHPISTVKKKNKP